MTDTEKKWIYVKAKTSTFILKAERLVSVSESDEETWIYYVDGKGEEDVEKLQGNYAKVIMQQLEPYHHFPKEELKKCEDVVKSVRERIWNDES